METIKLIKQVDKTGKLHLELPTSLVNQKVKVVIVLQSLANEPCDELGWPIDYFEETYGILAEDPIERSEQGILETRETLR
jgi:hypothetical protein